MRKRTLTYSHLNSIKLLQLHAYSEEKHQASLLFTFAAGKLFHESVLGKVNSLVF